MVTACQTEDFAVEKGRLGDITSRKITFEEMSIETGAREAVKPFIRQKSGNALARNLVYNEQYGFYVDTDEILMKQQGDDITFTLVVYRDNPDGKTENLILSKQADGSYAVYLVKYNLSEGDKANLLDGSPVLNIDQKTAFFTLNRPSGSSDEGSFHAGDVVRLTDGTCWRITEIIAYTYQPWVIMGVQVDCDAMQDNDNSYSEDGNGNGGNGPATPTWHGVPVHGSANDGSSGDSSGSGSSAGGSSGDGTPGPVAPPVLTEPLVPEIIPDPCETTNKLENDADFKAKMTDLKLTTNQNFEKVYTAYDYPNANDQNDQYNYLDFSGTSQNPKAIYPIPYPDKFKGLMHSHYSGLLSVFSITDLEDLYTQMKNPDISDNLFSALVTKSGTQYLIIISDPVKFLAFGDRYLSSKSKRDKLIKISQNNYAINENGTNQVNEKGFVKMLSKLAGGLDVFSGNSDFSNWTKLTYDEQTDAVLPSDCL